MYRLLNDRIVVTVFGGRDTWRIFSVFATRRGRMLLHRYSCLTADRNSPTGQHRIVRHSLDTAQHCNLRRRSLQTSIRKFTELIISARTIQSMRTVTIYVDIMITQLTYNFFVHDRCVRAKKKLITKYDGETSIRTQTCMYTQI